MELIVIGSSNMDLVINVPRIPRVGETIIGTSSDMIFGGKGANQAVAAQRAGGKVSFITKIGEDAYGLKMKEHYQREALPPAMILNDKDEPTGVAQIWVSDQGENSIVVAPGANMKLMPEDIARFKAEIAQAKFVLIQLEIPIQTVEYIVSLADSLNTPVILNPAPAQALSNRLLENIWMLTPNESETELLTSIKIVDLESAKVAGKRLLEKGVKQVLITLGEKGCFLCNEQGFQAFNAFPANAKDTTAAGDVFNGTLAVGLTQNKPLDEAIRFASAAAAISVTRKGAQPSAPYKQEIQDFLIEQG